MTFSFPDGISPDAKFLDGHFVDNPLVPGAILVGYAVARLRHHGFDVDGFARVKFFSKLHPSVPFEITCRHGEKVSKLIWHAGDDVFAEARVQLSPSDG